MEEKNCGRYEGSLPEREISRHLFHWVANPFKRLVAGGYVDKDICQFYRDGSIEVNVNFYCSEPTLRVSVCSNVLKEDTLTDMAQRIGKAVLKYEEDMYHRFISDTSWKELRCSLKVPFQFLKGEMLDRYAKAIEERAFLDNVEIRFQNAIKNGVVGIDIKVNRDERFAEITTYIKDVELAYAYDNNVEQFLFTVAHDIYDIIRRWELYTCYQNALKKVANG